MFLNPGTSGKEDNKDTGSKGSGVIHSQIIIETMDENMTKVLLNRSS